MSEYHGIFFEGAPSPVSQPVPLLSNDTIFDATHAMPPMEGRVHGVQNGDQISTFRIRYILGEGGMGIVYCAQQDYPTRLVALKVLKRHRCTPLALKRFKREVQILGGLHHRGIAQIYAAGEAKDSFGIVPFLAMEFINGWPLTTYAENQKLTTHQRIKLFLKVCDAIQYAHEQGVVHRDLKPSNILVDKHGEPKILDFGLSAITAEDPSSTLATEPGQLVGTLAYMSPEQAIGSSQPEARWDIYSLGIIAFELLAHRRPYDPPANSPLDAVKMICERETSPLSSIDSKFRGDIDTIISKALEKHIERRYASVSEMASDLRRHLDNEPIKARRPSVLYRISKFTRRHKVLVSSVTAIITSLLIGLLIASHQATIARAYARDAETRLANALVSQGDALLAIGNGNDARTRYLEARDRYRSLGEPTIPAELGLWESQLRSRQPVRVWHAQEGHVTSIAYAPDGLSAVTGGSDNSVRMWDLTTTRERFRMLHNAPVNVVVVSHDGRKVASGSTDGVMKLWEFTTGKVIGTSGPSETAIKALAFSPDDRTIAWNSSKQVIIANVNSFDIQKVLVIPDGVTYFTYANDGRLATSNSEKIQLWQPETGKLLSEIDAKKQAIHNLAFSSDSQHLFIVRVQDIAKWDGSAILQPVKLRATKGFFVAPNNQAICINTDDTVQIYDITTGTVEEVIHPTKSDKTAAAISPRGTELLQASSNGDLALWHIGPTLGQTTISAHQGPVTTIAISPGGEFALSGSRDRKIKLWDIASGHLLRNFCAASEVNAVAFSNNGRLVFAGLIDGTVEVWDVVNSRQVFILHHNVAPVNYILPLHSGNTILVAYGQPFGIEQWDLNNHQSQRTLAGSSSETRYLTELNTGAILSLNDDGIMCRWNSLDAAPKSWSYSKVGLACGALLSSQDSIAIADVDGLINNVHPITGTATMTLRGHSRAISGVAQLSSERFIASISEDKSLRIWDLKQGKELRCINDSPELTMCMKGTPDGRTLVAGRENGSVRIWHLARQETEDELRQRAENAFVTLHGSSKSPAELLSIANWWDHSGCNDLAFEMYMRAMNVGAIVPPMAITRCAAKLGRLDKVLPLLRQSNIPDSFEIDIWSKDPDSSKSLDANSTEQVLER